MKKKVLAMVLAASMAFGTSMLAFAADTPVDSSSAVTVSANKVVAGDTISMKASVEQTTISVEIVVSGTVVANPYGLSTDSVSSSDTLGGAVITFTNRSATPIEVGLKGKITLPTYANTVSATNKVTVAATTADLKSATTKKVYVKANVVTPSSVEGTKIKSNASEVKRFSVKSSTTTKPVADLVYGTSPVAIASNPVLAAQGVTADGVSDAMAVVLSGETNISASSEWTNADAFTVVTTYDLKLGKTASVFQ